MCYGGGDFHGCQHTLFAGKILPEVLEEIGTDIDFLILDTMHSMPGENLDFLSAYPYLSKDAVVVLHDVHLSIMHSDEWGIATNVLFSAVTADKYYNLGSHWEYPGDLLPNIAAFQLNEDTPKYIMDVFAGLCLPWYYIPSREHLQLYGSALEKLGSQCVELYHRILHDQLCIANAKVKEVENLLMAMSASSHVLLYGKGLRGKALLRLCKKIGVNVSAFVVSDGRSTAGDTEGIPVYEYSKIPYAKDSLIIIQSAWSTEISHQLETSDYRVLTLSEEQWKWVLWYVGT